MVHVDRQRVMATWNTRRSSSKACAVAGQAMREQRVAGVVHDHVRPLQALDPVDRRQPHAVGVAGLGQLGRAATPGRHRARGRCGPARPGCRGRRGGRRGSRRGDTGRAASRVSSRPAWRSAASVATRPPSCRRAWPPAARRRSANAVTFAWSRSALSRPASARSAATLDCSAIHPTSVRDRPAEGRRAASSRRPLGSRRRPPGQAQPRQRGPHAGALQPLEPDRR